MSPALPEPRVTLLVFVVDGQRYGLPVEQVDEVLPMAWLTRVADCPPDVCGLLDVRGTLWAVVDPALRLGAALRPPRPSDLLVLVRSPAGSAALRVDDVDGLATDQVTPTPPQAEGPAFVRGHARSGGALVTVLDVAVFFRPELHALAAGGGGA